TPDGYPPTSTMGSGTQVVQVIGIQIQAVDDLPQRRQGLQGVALLVGRQVRTVALHHLLEVFVAGDQPLLRLVELITHEVLHQSACLSSAEPTTRRSSTSRRALSSKRGSEPLSTRRTRKLSPPWAFWSARLNAEVIATSSAAGSGSSMRTSISSRIPSV